MLAAFFVGALPRDHAFAFRHKKALFPWPPQLSGARPGMERSGFANRGLRSVRVPWDSPVPESPLPPSPPGAWLGLRSTLPQPVQSCFFDRISSRFPSAGVVRRAGGLPCGDRAAFPFLVPPSCAWPMPPCVP